MGNCFQKINKSSPSSEIVPADMLKPKPLPSPPAITLYGPSNCPITMYIRFALSYKPVSVQFVNSNTLSDMFLDSPVLQFGSVRVSGSPVTILDYLDSKFPAPEVGRRRTAAAESAAEIVEVVVLQHRSVTWHVERVVAWAEDLVTRKGIGRGDRKVGTTRMEVKKFGKRYGELLEVMLEHARMEERVVFPVLEKADRGLC